jgi:hypothetical protein
LDIEELCIIAGHETWANALDSFSVVTLTTPSLEVPQRTASSVGHLCFWLLGVCFFSPRTWACREFVDLTIHVVFSQTLANLKLKPLPAHTVMILDVGMLLLDDWIHMQSMGNSVCVFFLRFILVGFWS